MDIIKYFLQEKEKIDNKYNKYYNKLYKIAEQLPKKYYIKLLKIEEELEKENDNLEDLLKNI